MQRYYITDRRAFPSRSEFLANIAARIHDNVDMIQIREKDLDAGDLTRLTRDVVDLARGTDTKILVNGRADIALAAGADGIHLPANSILPIEFRRLGIKRIGVPCHNRQELEEAADADFVV